MNVRTGHLKEERLFDCYLAGHDGEPLDPRAADHLASCQDCAARYDELVTFMSGLSDEASAETDELFPAERLDAQRQQILRRVEHLNRSARVITFPGREATPSRAPVHLTPRWVAAAAAAGLFIGVAVGGYIGPDRLRQPRVTRQASGSAPAMTPVQRPAPNAALLVNGSQAEAPDDDTFLMELELALARPHTRELQPFDAMTPRARDIDNRER